MEDVELLTVPEVAKRYRLTGPGVIRKLNTGKLKGFKVGGTWRLPAEQFREIEKAAQYGAVTR